MSRPERRNDYRRDEPRETRRYEEERKPHREHRDDSRSRGVRDHGNSRAMGNERPQQQFAGSRGQHNFNGMAFSESELMLDLPKKKFTGRCRLFIGNIPNEVKEEELKELFTPHGDIAECYLSGKGFAFLRMDTRAHAESAKEAVDGIILHGRQVRVRFAVHGAALRVKELSPTVSNEMLYHAFSHFGEVERAVHIVDEKGRPTGEGIVEFERKPNCMEAITAIRDKVFLLTASPKPLIVEPVEPRDEDDGLAERMIPRTPQLSKEREMGPRFPTQNSFEFVYGMKWKELYEMEKQRRNQMEEELKEARHRLEQDMELAYQDYQAQMLREDLQRRQQELERLEQARRERLSTMRPTGPPPMMQPNPITHFGSAAGFGGMPMGGFGSGGGPPGPPQPMHGGGQNYPPTQAMAPPNRPPAAGGPSGVNMLEGVQRLLNIFKNDGGRAPQGVPPPGQPSTRHYGGSDYHSEPKRSRR